MFFSAHEASVGILDDQVNFPAVYTKRIDDAMFSNDRCEASDRCGIDSNHRDEIAPYRLFSPPLALTFTHT